MKYGIVVAIISGMLFLQTASGDLVGHYKLDGDLTDSSALGDNPTGTLGGNAVYTNIVRVGSHAVSLDGTGDYVNLGDNFDMGTGDMTVSVWVKTTEKKFARIVSKEGAGGFNLSLNATLGVGCTIDGLYQYFSILYEDGSYHHFAATYDRDGVATVYWDGVALGTFDISSKNGLDLNNTEGLYLGWRSTGGSGDFYGMIDDVRIYDECLSAADIKELSRFSAHFTFDGNATNEFSKGPYPSGTLTGDAAYTNYARVGSQAITLDGTGDYVTFEDDFDINRSDWTVAFWMKTSVNEFARFVCKERWAVSTGSDNTLSVFLDGSGLAGAWQLLRFSLPSGTYYDNRFHHVAAVLDRDDAVTMYWDGVAIGSEDISTNANANIRDGGPLMVGARFLSGSPNAEFNGIIDDVRIYNETLSAEDILKLAEFSFQGHTSAHYAFDGDADNSAPDGPRPTGLPGGDAAYTNDARVGSAAMSFDGTGDFVSLGDVFDISTNDLTIAAWIKTTEKAFARIIAKESTSGYNISVSGVNGVGCALGSTYEYFSATYEDGKFHHLAATYDRDDVATLYFDGEALGTFDISAKDGLDLNTAASLYIGWRTGSAAGSGDFHGIIDDVQIYNRVLSAEEINDLIPPPPGTLLLLN